MVNPQNRIKQQCEIRKLAEEKVQDEASLLPNPGYLSPDNVKNLLHELRVHQVQLEMQNEELRCTHAKLEATQHRYFDLYDLAPVGYLTLSDQGLILEANLTSAAMLGVFRNALINKPLTKIIYKEDLDLLYVCQKRLYLTNLPQDCEIRILNQDKIVWVHLVATAALQLDGTTEFRVVLHDISERKRVEETLKQFEIQHIIQLERANAQLKEKAESLNSIYQVVDSVGLIVCDLEEVDGKINIFNSGAEKMFGYQQSEAVGKSISLIYLPERIGIIPDRVKKFSQGMTINSIDMTLMRKSGERFSAIVSVHPFDLHEGKYRKVIGVIRDISELISAQNQLKAANDSLEQRVEQRTRELQESQKQYLHAEKLSAIGKLSASIAHEFNNPLQGILSILKGLKKRAILDNEDSELLNAAIAESDRIKDLIRSLQDFNRPSSNKKGVVDIHKSLDSILLLNKSDFRGKRISVVRNYTEESPQIFAVPDQIKQVFLNLLTNAADSCQQRGGIITVNTWQDDDKVAVAIKDTGIGINPNDMELIFQPFYTTKSAVKGTGLGLSVSYGIVKNHQGEIRVESEPGEGSTFTVLLPIKGDTGDVV